MDNQISLFPDVLGAEIEQIVKTELSRMQEVDYENYIPPIKSLHEGYGYTAEEFANLTTQHKRLKDSLGTYLNLLSNTERIDSTIGDIYSEAMGAAKEAIKLAAIAERIISGVRCGEILPEEAYGESDTDEEPIEYEDTDNGEE